MASHAGKHRRPTQERPRKRVVAVVATPVALMVSGALVWSSTNAAFTAQVNNGGNSWSTGTVVLSGDDGSNSTTPTVGTAMFTPTNLAPGDTGENCVTVTYAGTLPANVKLYIGSALTGDATLAANINLVIKEGDGGAYGNCTGFVPTATIWNDDLAALRASHTSFATGRGFWAATNGTVKTYQIAYELDAAAPNSVQGKSAGATLSWEAQNS